MAKNLLLNLYNQDLSRPYGMSTKSITDQEQCTETQINHETLQWQNLLLNLLMAKKLNTMTNGTIHSKHAVWLIRSVSIQCNAIMQCNAMQCNAMQCTIPMQYWPENWQNAMQCMYRDPSVRTE
jgi:hypothetical protein